MVLLRRLQNHCGCAGTGAAERSAVSLCCFPVRGFPTLPRTFERTTRMMVAPSINVHRALISGVTPVLICV